LNRSGWRRASFMLDLASGNALFFLFDFHDQILSGPDVLALMTSTAFVASTIVAVMTAAATTMPTQESE
jgi:hypothetical protein